MKILKIFYKFLYTFFIPKNGVSYLKVKRILNQNNFSFECTKCGKCCFGQGNVYFTKKDLNQIQNYLKIQDKNWGDFKKQFIDLEENGLYIHQPKYKCFFLNKKNQCSIYPIRPLQCKSFPFWPSNFSSLERLKNLIKECPGSNLTSFKKNSYYPPEEIVFYCNQTIKKFNSYQKKKGYFRL